MDTHAVETFLSQPEERRAIRNSNCTYRMDGQISISVPIVTRSWRTRAYVDSPISMLSSYGRSNAKNLAPGLNRFLAVRMSPALTFLLQLLRIDRYVLVGNLPFSTVLHYHTGPGELVAEVLRIRETTNRPVGIRGLNEFEHQRELKAFANRDFVVIPARRINIVSDFDEAMKHRDARRDLKLLERQPDLDLTETSSVSEKDAETIADLYQGLYIQKYSEENPYYSPGFIRSSINSGILRGRTLRHRSKGIVGFNTYYTNSTTMTGPMMGYRMDLNSEYPLYRILMIAQLSDALSDAKILNWSSGSDRFKKNRGADQYMEYLCVLPDTKLERQVFNALKKLMISFLGGESVHG